MSTHADWYERAYPDLTGHGLWLRGGEINTLPLAELEKREFRVLFARLSTYFDTGYSFTHQLLYQIAAGVEGVWPDLAYLPPARDAEVFERAGVPWLVGTRSKLGALDFDLVGFSNSIVQELVNLPHFLEKSGVPLSKEERLASPEIPIVLLGGANALYTSAIWGPDPLVDAVFVGESDEAIRKILQTCRDAKRAGLGKAATLDALEEIPGVLTPDRPRRTTKAFVWNLNRSEALERGPVYYIEEQLGSSHLQISEGCPCFCSFCAESWDRKPYRERRAETLREAALAAKSAMGLDSIDLYSFNFNMHSGFYQILWDLAPLFRSIGLKSQRFDLLAHDPEMVEFQHAIEKASLTCGLEGVSPRMRRYLHKNLENEDLHASLAAIFRSSARQLKVFLIATGLEEEPDFLAFADFLDHMKEIRESLRAGTRVIFSITPLVRFPWTPLEFEDAPTTGRLAGILSRTADLVRRSGFEFRESADLPEYWVSQVLIRASDPRILRALVRTVRETGFVYYREIPESFALALEKNLVEAGIDLAAAFAGYSLEESRAKPWALVETGVHREFLWAEVLRARAYDEIDYCLGRSWTRAKCFHCGGCPSKEHVRDLVLARQERGYGLTEFRERLRSARRATVTVSVLVDVGSRGRGVPRKMVAVATARALMLAQPALAPYYKGYAGSSWENPDRGPVWVEGADAIRLEWHARALPLLESLLASAEERSRVDRELAGWGSVLGLAPEDWTPERIEFESPFPFAGAAYLGPAHLAATRYRTGAGSHRYEFSREALRRKILRSLTVESNGTGARGSVTPGEKFDASEFAARAFETRGPNDHVRIRMWSVARVSDPRVPDPPQSPCTLRVRPA